MSIKYSERLVEAGIEPSVEPVDPLERAYSTASKLRQASGCTKRLMVRVDELEEQVLAAPRDDMM